MKKTLTLSGILMAATLLSSCEPTPRTAVGGKGKGKPDTQQSSAKTENSDAEAEQEVEKKVETKVEEPVAPAKEKTAADYLQENPTRALLSVKSALQSYTMMRPWQKNDINNMQVMGVYLGDGLVLTAGQVANDPTYMEISLPDGSQTVPAKVISYDADLQLALVSVAHEKDASIFESRIALPLGEPLKVGDAAEYWGSVSGTEPLRIPITSKGSEATGTTMPRIALQSPQSLPKGETFGYPIVREGQLVALSTGFNSDKQSFLGINAELIKRFVEAKASIGHKAPMLGLHLVKIDDPVMSKYLQLPEGRSGLYISKVDPLGAAAEAGLKAEDVILSIDGYEIDKQGTVQHPLYGRLGAQSLLRSIRPLGESVSLEISRMGELEKIEVKLTRVAAEKALIGELGVGERPRYLIHGGLLFQPLSRNYLNELQEAAKGNLPEEYLTLEDRNQKLIEEGYSELTALTYVIPSPAVLGYEKLGYCFVEKVNGKTVHSFDELAVLLDEPTANGITSISINKSPYTIYIKQKDAAASNDMIRRNAIPRLRQMKSNSVLAK